MNENKISDSNKQRDKIAQIAAEKIDGAYRFGSVYVAKRVIAAALDEYAEGLREKVLQEAARAVCEYCRDEHEIIYKAAHKALNGTHWFHDKTEDYWIKCYSSNIYDIIAAMQAEDGEEKNERGR